MVTHTLGEFVNFPSRLYILNPGHNLFNIDASFEISAKEILSKVGRTEEMFSNSQDLHIIGNTSLHLNVNVFSTRLSSRFSFLETLGHIIQLLHHLAHLVCQSFFPSFI